MNKRQTKRTDDYTNEEAKALRGTEYTYIFEDGDTVRCFISQVDLEIGLTCKALTQYTDRDSYKLWHAETEDGEYDNMTCVDNNPGAIQRRLKDIVNTGFYIQSRV